MKKLLTVFALLTVGLISFAQKQQVKIGGTNSVVTAPGILVADSALVPALDTFQSATIPIYSIAVKGTTIYVKGNEGGAYGGWWHGISGGGGGGTVTSISISNDSVYYNTSSGKTFVFLAVTKPDSLTGYTTPTQLTTALATKEPVITPANVADRYWNGYKQFVLFNADSIPGGATNKYFTTSDTAGLRHKADTLAPTGTASRGMVYNSLDSLNAALRIPFTTTVGGMVPPPGSVNGYVLSDGGTWIPQSGGGGPGADTNYVYATSYFGSGTGRDATSAFQTMYNYAAVHNKTIVVNGNFVDSSTLNAPTSGSLSVSWRFLNGCSITYAAKTGSFIQWASAAFHDITIDNPQVYFSNDTTSIGNNCFFFQGVNTGTKIHRVIIRGGVISGASTSILGKGLQELEVSGTIFLSPLGHDNATTTSNPATHIRAIDDSIGDENKSWNIHDCVFDGFSQQGSKAVTTLKTGGRMDGAFYGHVSGLIFHHNISRHFDEEHVVNQPAIYLTDSLPSSIDNNTMDCAVLPGSEAQGVAITSVTGIRAEGQHLAINGNKIYHPTVGIQFYATGAWNYVFRNLVIDGNTIWASQDTASNPSVGIYVQGYSSSVKGKGAEIINNRIILDSVRLKGTFQALTLNYFDSSTLSNNQVVESRVTRTGGGVWGVSGNTDVNLIARNNILQNVDTVSFYQSSTVDSGAGSYIEVSPATAQTASINITGNISSGTAFIGSSAVASNAAIVAGTGTGGAVFTSMWNSSTGANNKTWRQFLGVASLTFDLLNDAQTSSTPWMVINRNTTAVSSVTFPAIAPVLVDTGLINSSGAALQVAGKVSISKADTSTVATGGYLFRDASSGLLKIGPGGTGGSGATIVGTFSGSSIANGASIFGTTITFGPADGTYPGMVTTGTQLFAGNKRFSGNVDIGGASVPTSSFFTLEGAGSLVPGSGHQGIFLNTIFSNLTNNDPSTTGTSSFGLYGFSFNGPTLSATNTGVTYPEAATVYINAAPTAGTNATLTTKWALEIGSGNSLFNGNVTGNVGSILTFTHLLGNNAASNAPSIAAGSGAGTSPTVSIQGGDQDGAITVTTGASPGLSATVATITYGYAFPNNSYVVLYPANTVTAALGTLAVYTTGSTTNFTLTSPATGLSAAATYKWYYHVGGN